MNSVKIDIDKIDNKLIKSLKAGDRLLLSGVIYTARDAAHKRMCEDFLNGKGFPFDISGKAVYYAGPCPAKPGEVIGSCGPTTSGRMDSYTPLLLDNGLKVMIGKGQRNEEVIKSMKKNTCIYLGTIGGAGALIAESIMKAEVLAYDDLGTEAIRRLEVVDFPCTVLIDSDGNNIYETGIKQYRKL